MNASVESESNSRPSRRALLAGALGGIGGWALGAIGRASPVRANDGDALVTGVSNYSTNTTYLTNSSAHNAAFQVSTSGDGGAVRGFCPTGNAVYGDSNFDIGVWGQGGAGGTGVMGRSAAADKRGVLGWATNNSTGVQGFSNGGLEGELPVARAKTGVYGYAGQDGSSVGVFGGSASGYGIYGRSSVGWAGYFDGRVLIKQYAELVETATPSAPGSNHARLFVRDNGSDKTQLCVRFHTGAVKVLATQP
jgi:hypothetical protein